MYNCFSVFSSLPVFILDHLTANASVYFIGCLVLTVIVHKVSLWIDEVHYNSVVNL